MKKESKFMMLDSTIVLEMERVNKKMTFWKVGVEETDQSWCCTDSLTLEQSLKAIDPEVDLRNRNDLLLYGIGWEFIWGMAAPEIVRECREEIIMKARCGLKMSELEKLWYELICVDTDMF